MASNKSNSAHVEHAGDHVQDKTLESVVALASLFSDCVEAFGLIHAHNAWERQEKLIMAKLGIQQARLLVWGSILGVSCPPASIATHMIPSHPGYNNPTPDDAVYFGTRDRRLDNPELRKKIDAAITDLIDRSEHASPQDMMSHYGLEPSKKGMRDHEPALDTKRLDGFREKYSLLVDLAQAQGLAPPRSNSLTAHSWTISKDGLIRFSSFVEMIRVRVDALVTMMGLDERIDRAVKNDIRTLGWHPTGTRAEIAMNVSRLMIIRAACEEQYPSYSWVVQQALDNIDDKWKGSHGYDKPPASVKPAQPPGAVHTRQPPSTTQSLQLPNAVPSPDKPAAKHKRPGVLSFIRAKSWRKPSEKEKALGQTDSGAYQAAFQIPRSQSYAHAPAGPSNALAPLEAVRSRSVDDQPIMPMDGRMSEDNALTPTWTVDDDALRDLAQMKTVTSMISRHDQWRKHAGRGD